jgi:TRAP-type mannitol/chloroaromatic compound transport system substrate-binding protein
MDDASGRSGNRAKRPAKLGRRELLRGAAASAAAVAAGGVAACARPPESASVDGAPAVHARPRVRWRLASSFPPGLDTIYGVCDVLATELAALSAGRFEVRVYPAGEIVPALQVLDAVQAGTVHAGQTASYYYTGKHPALAFDTCVPFGLTARQHSAWLLEAGGDALVQELFADFGVRVFPAGNTGTQMGGWFKREISSLADLRGLKMRIPGLGGEVMSRLGVAVQVLSGGEIFPALERGAIDAAEWVGPYDDEKLGFHRAARYYYYPGWWEPGPHLSFYVNTGAWEKLPAELRAMWTLAAHRASIAMLTRYDARNGPALERLRAAGVELRAFPRDLLAGARRESEAMLAEGAARDPAYRRIFEHWRSFRRTVFDWFAVAEQSYTGFVHPATSE